MTGAAPQSTSIGGARTRTFFKLAGCYLYDSVVSEAFFGLKASNRFVSSTKKNAVNENFFPR